MPIANPFTRFLRHRLRGTRHSEVTADGMPALVAAEAFARYWDEVETLIIQVYKSGKARRADRADWRALRAGFPAVYAPVERPLASHWPGTRAGGEPVTENPFLRLVGTESARSFVGDWSSMQHLPAAREALNRLLVHLGAIAT